MLCSRAPGKILLFGEHFVVKGEPALGLAVSLYVKTCIERGEGKIYSKQLGLIKPSSQHWPLFEAVFNSVEARFGEIPRVDVVVDSEIPISSGMGSSAATAVSLTHALLSFINVEFTKREVQEIAHEAEKTVHYRPSGVDTTLATHGGFLYYKQGVFKRLDLKLPANVAIVVVNTGIPRQTGVVVREVLERYERLGRIGEYIYRAAGEIVENGIKAIENNDIDKLGELMLVNHGLLWAMGASSEECDKTVYELIRLGAIGAKISGAGRGGIIIGLTRRENLEKIKSGLTAKKYEYYIVEPDYQGVTTI